MSAIQFDKHIHRPIADLPELTPLVGRTVHITATDPPAASPLASLDQLRGSDRSSDFEGFDAALRRWRAEPWRAEEE
jgi:hypothetical protein